MKKSNLLTVTQLAALAGMMGASTKLPAMPIFAPFEPGTPIGASASPGQVFLDSRGQAYVRDNRGTIRRVRGGQPGKGGQ